jgi:SAM-dependent methyltransferase
VSTRVAGCSGSPDATIPERAAFCTATRRGSGQVSDIKAASLDAVVFMLSIQDIDPLGAAIEGAAWSLRDGGRLVILMTHPCFRVPRQSGWGWDSERRLCYRRVDRYLTPLDVPMKRFAGGRGATWSHHRPLASYVDALASNGLLIDAVREIPAQRRPPPGPKARGQRLADREIPLFMGLRASKRRSLHAAEESP